MKRWTLRILIMLVLGVVTTVAVAWGFAWFDREWRVGMTIGAMKTIYSDGGYVSSADERGDGVGFEWRVANSNNRLTDSLSTGWPMIAVSATATEDFQGARPLVGRSRLAVIQQMRMPILPGFIINTLFYAALWFALLFGWRAHRRLIRKWQGYCPICKYDLRGGEIGTDEQKNGGTEDAAHFRSSVPPSRRSEPGCPECGWGRPGS